MTKQSGLGDNLYVAGYDVSGDIGSLSRIGGGPSLQEVTGIDKSAVERIGVLRDGSLEFNAWFNPSADRAHDRLSALPTADQVVTYCRGTTIGGQAAAMVGKQIDYAGNRGTDGSLAFSVQAQSNGFGLEWCRQLTAGKRTDGGATNGAGLDLGAGSTTFGLQAWLQVFAFTGTSATVKLQQSSDDAAGDPYADVTGGGFTAATGVTAERIETARDLTVERWLRVVTTGTFSNLVFAVAVARNDVEVEF